MGDLEKALHHPFHLLAANEQRIYAEQILRHSSRMLESPQANLPAAGTILGLMDQFPAKQQEWTKRYFSAVNQAVKTASDPAKYRPQWADYLIARWYITGDQQTLFELVTRSQKDDENGRHAMYMLTSMIQTNRMFRKSAELFLKDQPLSQAVLRHPDPIVRSRYVQQQLTIIEALERKRIDAGQAEQEFRKIGFGDRLKHIGYLRPLATSGLIYDADGHATDSIQAGDIIIRDPQEFAARIESGDLLLAGNRLPAPTAPQPIEQ